MIVVKPITFDLEYTNVLDHNPDAYAPATEYALGSLVLFTDDKIYKSLQDVNIGNAPDVSEDWWVYTQDKLPEEYDAEVTYAAGVVVSDLVNQKLYESLQDANTGNSLTASEWWFELGATNSAKMFDQFVNTKTENYDSLHIKIAVERADYVTLFGVNGQEIVLKLWDATQTTLLWESSFDMLYEMAVVAPADWYEYFFGEYSLKEDFGTELGAIMFSSILEIEIKNPGHIATCSKLLIGRRHVLGSTEYGVSAGIVDYSRNLVDDFGRRYMKPGNWSKRNDVTVYVENHQLDAVYRLLTSLRGTSTAWITDSRKATESRHESLILFGFYRDFSIVISNSKISECRLEVEGMI